MTLMDGIPVREQLLRHAGLVIQPSRSSWRTGRSSACSPPFEGFRASTGPASPTPNPAIPLQYSLMDIYEELVRLRNLGQKCALATIVEVRGSIPSYESAKMLVREDGTIAGPLAEAV